MKSQWQFMQALKPVASIYSSRTFVSSKNKILYLQGKCCRQQNILCQSSTTLLPNTTYNDGKQKWFHTTNAKTSKALTIWRDVKALRSSPLPALALGISGLIPFTAAPIYMLSQIAYIPEISTAQIAYGACILSFLGGVRWGITLPEESVVPSDWINLGYSVIPALIAWGGLLLPPTAGLLTVMGGLGLAAYLDITMYGYPAWFKGLRFILSFVAILALWSSFMCSIILPTSENHPTALPVVKE